MFSLLVTDFVGTLTYDIFLPLFYWEHYKTGEQKIRTYTEACIAYVGCIPFSVSNKIYPIEQADILLSRNCNKHNSRLD